MGVGGLEIRSFGGIYMAKDFRSVVSQGVV